MIAQPHDAASATRYVCARALSKVVESKTYQKMLIDERSVLVKMSFILFFAAHMFACTFYLIGKVRWWRAACCTALRIWLRPRTTAAVEQAQAYRLSFAAVIVI